MLIKKISQQKQKQIICNKNAKGKLLKKKKKKQMRKKITEEQKREDKTAKILEHECSKRAKEITSTRLEG